MKKKLHLIKLLAFSICLIFTNTSLQAQWNTNTSQNLEISGLQTADMQTASTSDGKLWVAFYHENAGNYDMRAQLFDASGNKLLGPDGVLVSNQTSGSATFVFNVCVDGSNNLVIGCQDQRSGDLQAVVYKISQSGTHLWNPTGIILGVGLVPYPAALTNGDIVVTWNGDATNTLQIQRINPVGTFVWATPVSVMVGGSTTTRGQIVANLNNGFTMVYQKNAGGISTNLYAQKFDLNGIAQYAPLQICNQTTAGYRYYSITAEADTTYFGYYSSSGFRFNSFVQRINPNGTIPWGMNGSNFNTSTGGSDNYQGTTNICQTPGSPYIWSVCTFSDPNQEDYGVYIQKFRKTTGARQFTDLGKAVYPVSSNTNMQEGKLLLTDDTPLFMSYNSNYKIYVTKLDAAGNFVWSYNRAEISSTTSTLANPKGRYDFCKVGNYWNAGIWTEDRGTADLGYIQGISNGGLFGMDVTTQGNVPASITIGSGTLQLLATIYPDYANQSVSWNIIPVTGTAIINSTGLVTALADGTVWAKATSVQDLHVSDSILITISGQIPVLPDVVTLPASNIGLETATLNGSVDANNFISSVSFEWGLTSSYGNITQSTPSQVTGSVPTPVLTHLSGLIPGTTYHFRCAGTNSAGTVYGEDQSFSTDCQLPGTIGTITGNPAVCVNASGIIYSVEAFNNATSYIWTVPTGAVITAGMNTNEITVDFSASAQSGELTVFASDGVCYSNPSEPYSVTVSYTPVAAGTIVGNQIVCEGDQGIVYTVAPISGANSYTWTIPTGAQIIAGLNTNTITINFEPGSVSGTVTVYGTNSCGNGLSSSIIIDVAPLPGDAGAISGSVHICTPAANVVYSISPVSNAYGYVWSLPPGAVITDGSNSNQITVSYATTASSGNVSVYATNGNCPGAPAEPLMVSVFPTPATPFISQHGDTLTSSAAAGNQWYLNGAEIAGATSQEHVAVYSGYYTVAVTLNDCNSELSESILVLPVSLPKESDNFQISIVPNPNKGEFVLEVIQKKSSDFTIEVYDPSGKLIWQKEVNQNNGLMSQPIDLKNPATGTYFVLLRSVEGTIFRKMAVNK